MRNEKEVKALGNWIKVQQDVAIVDTDEAYPLYLKELAKLKNNLLNGTANQFSVEVARRCITLDIRRLTGPGLKVRLIGSKYGLAGLPKGPDSPEAGASGFRKFYRELVVARGEVLL